MEADAKSLGYSDTELASVAGIAQVTVSRIFRGQQPAPRTAKKIASALGKQLRRYVVTETEPPAVSQ